MVSPRRMPGPFGVALRRWRERRGVSQLALAQRSATTARHVSFLETGRSRPGEAIVLRLAEALEVPLAARNELLAAAGLPPAYSSIALDDDAMLPIRGVLDQVLARHEPFPAWVFGRGLTPLRANRAGARLFPGLTERTPEQIVDLWFSEAFRGLVENWEDVASAGVASLRRDAERTADPTLWALARRAESQAVAPMRAGVGRDLPVVCPRFCIGGETIRTISTVLRFDTAIDTVLSELRVELMFPADPPSDHFFRRLEEAGGSGETLGAAPHSSGARR